MTRERLNELWPAMEHFKNGGDVEARLRDTCLVDWILIKDPKWESDFDYRIAQPKPMTFMEAVEAMKQGKRVRRQLWGIKDSILEIKSGWIEWCHSDIATSFRIDDIEATDWEVVQ